MSPWRTDRLKAVKSLMHNANQEALDLLVRASDDRSPQVRSMVVEALAENPAPRALRTLARALNDRSDYTRLLAVTALTKRADVESVGALIPLLWLSSDWNYIRGKHD